MTSAEAARAIVRALEADIVLGRLHPRERLVEDQLVARFKAKRHVVRQALAELDAVGLVARAPARGAAVRELGAEEVEQLYTMREIVEDRAARMIPLPIKGAARTRIAALCEAYAAAVEAEDLPGVIAANKGFHHEVYRLCGNRFLADTVDLMAQKANLVRFSNSADPGHLRRAAEEHCGILAALDGDDPEHLATLCLAHIQPARRAYLDRLSRLAPKETA